MLHCYLAKDPSTYIEIPYCEIANGEIVKLETKYYPEIEAQIAADTDFTFITFVHVEIDGVVEKIEGEQFCREIEKQLGRGKFSTLVILPVGQEPKSYVRVNKIT